MSKVNLTAVVWFKAGEDGRPATNKVYLQGIDTKFESISFPKKGITFFYGNRNAGVAYLLEEAARQGLASALVDIPVDVGVAITNKISFDDDPERGLSYTGFCSIRRVKKDIINALDEIWRDSGSAYPDFNEGITNPVNFDRVMEDPRFQHLNVISYNIKLPQLGAVQVATIYKLSAIEGVRHGALLDDVEIVPVGPVD